MAGQNPQPPSTNQPATMWRGLWGPSGLTELLWEHYSGCSHYGTASAEHSTEIRTLFKPKPFANYFSSYFSSLLVSPGFTLVTNDYSYLNSVHFQRITKLQEKLPICTNEEEGKRDGGGG